MERDPHMGVFPVGGAEAPLDFRSGRLVEMAWASSTRTARLKVVSEELTLADATKKYTDATLARVFALVSEPSRWLVLRPGEQQPRVIESRPSECVRWSSLWPAAPRDTVFIDLVAVGEATAQRAAGTGTELRFRWVTDSPPDERGVGLVRFRLNYIFGSELRGWLV